MLFCSILAQSALPSIGQLVDPIVQLVSFLSHLVIVGAAAASLYVFVRWWRANALRDWWMWGLTYWPKDTPGGITRETFKCDWYEPRQGISTESQLADANSNQKDFETSTEIADNNLVQNREDLPREFVENNKPFGPPPPAGPRLRQTKVPL